VTHNSKISRVVYSFVVADLFHFGHLQLLKTAKALGDYHVCGVLSDEAVETYRNRPVANYDERHAVISSIDCVDHVVRQDHKDPTDNLKWLSRKYPEAKLILVHGNDWHQIPGREYVESVGGEVVQPEYYRRLADNRIREQILTNEIFDFEQLTEHFRIDGITYFKKKGTHHLISTKANTLKFLQPLLKKSHIEKTFIFRTADWKRGYRDVVEQIKHEFDNTIVVRSSTINEDSHKSSMAGFFDSVLDVPAGDGRAIKKAVECVLKSYTSKGYGNDLDQVLVQNQTVDVAVSGVVFTENIDGQSHYYLVNYDDKSGRTDTVTSGRCNRHVEIFKYGNTDRYRQPWCSLVDAVREIECLIPDVALDIEFALDSEGSVIIYQVRPLTIMDTEKNLDENSVKRSSNYLAQQRRRFARLEEKQSGHAKRQSFSDMAFWNPAEIIGERHSRLAYSLYRNLITSSAWNTGIVPLGYTELGNKELMTEFAGKAYIDLGKALNALLPQQVGDQLRGRLINGCLDLVHENNDLHDKIEFEVLDSSFVFDADDRVGHYQALGIGKNDYSRFANILVDLTNRMAIDYTRYIDGDFAALEHMHSRRQEILRDSKSAGRDARELMAYGLALFKDCRRLGTAAFARQARMAFVGNALLTSMCRSGCLTDKAYTDYLASLTTVAKEFSHDFQACLKGDMSKRAFNNRYGHLRPNTYDITSPRYDRSPALFRSETPAATTDVPKGRGAIKINKKLAMQLMSTHGVEMEFDELMMFIKTTIETRERHKFEFTRNISDGLELLAAAGKKLGMERAAMADLSIGQIGRACKLSSDKAASKMLKENIEKSYDSKQHTVDIVLPSVIDSAQDFYIVSQVSSRPNFVTRESVSAGLVSITQGRICDSGVLSGKVVLIQNADPGYDWIFTKGITGLITCYGGVASHMAIRCAEFGLPAAIGCGESIYKELLDAPGVHIDCAQGIIKAVRDGSDA
jgi:glutamine kinase